MRQEQQQNGTQGKQSTIIINAATINNHTGLTLDQNSTKANVPFPLQNDSQAISSRSDHTSKTDLPSQAVNHVRTKNIDNSIINNINNTELNIQNAQCAITIKDNATGVNRIPIMQRLRTDPMRATAITASSSCSDMCSDVQEGEGVNFFFFYFIEKDG
jgi:hypothetical protein